DGLRNARNRTAISARGSARLAHSAAFRRVHPALGEALASCSQRPHKRTRTSRCKTHGDGPRSLEERKPSFGVDSHRSEILKSRKIERRRRISSKMPRRLAFFMRTCSDPRDLREPARRPQTYYCCAGAEGAFAATGVPGGGAGT